MSLRTLLASTAVAAAVALPAAALEIGGDTSVMVGAETGPLTAAVNGDVSADASATTSGAAATAGTAGSAMAEATLPDYEMLTPTPDSEFIDDTVMTSDDVQVGVVTEVRSDAETGTQVLCAAIAADIEATATRACFQVGAGATADGELNLAMTSDEFRAMVGANVN